MRTFLLSILLIPLLLFGQSASRLALTYSTYYGGHGKETVTDEAIDADNNRIIVGYTNSTQYISTSGSFQESSNGLNDAFISKWSVKGELLWATYFGGEFDDYIHGVSTDIDGNIYVAGRTKSPKNIATKNAVRTKIAGSTDAFIAKFNSNGKLIWSTYWGGSGIDAIERISVKGNSMVIVVGGTFSDTGISTANAHQTIKGRGNDGFMTLLDTSGSVVWSTYYGGADADGIRNVTINEKNEIIITGESTSTSMISTIQSHQRYIAGETDAFVAKFDSTGKRIWGTYIGGSADDSGMGVQCDENGFIYVTGNTKSSSGIATPGAYDTTLSGGIRDITLWKFSPKGKLIWGTYFGGTSHDYSYNLDYYGGKLLMSGYSMNDGFSYKTMVQDSLNSVLDGIIIEFDTTGALFHSTYFGGQLNDFINAAMYDKFGQIIYAGQTQSTKNIATANAYRTTKNMNEDVVWGVIGSRLGHLSMTNCGPYTWNGVELETSGTYHQTIDTTGKTDSILVLSLSVLSPKMSFESEQHCASFQWRGKEINQSGTYHDTLDNAASNGCDSIIQLTAEVFAPKLTKLSSRACKFYYWTTTGKSLTKSGIYTDTLRGYQGCDSIVMLDLKVDNLTARATVTGSMLSASSGDTYQWLDCDLDFKEMPNANSSVYQAPYTGFFAVEISLGTCIDTSDCTFIEVETNDLTVLHKLNSVYPNPCKRGQFIYISGITEFSWGLLDPSGRRQFDGCSRNKGFQIPACERGVYFLRIIPIDGKAFTTRIVVD